MKKTIWKRFITLSKVRLGKIASLSLALILLVSFFPGFTANAASTYWTSTTFSNLFHTTRYITVPANQSWCIKVNVTSISPANSTLGIIACSSGGNSLYSGEFQITGTGTVYVYLTQPSSTSSRNIYLRIIKRSGTGNVTCAGTWENIVPTSGVTVSPGSITLNPGNTYQLSAAVSPSNAGVKDVEWTSSSAGVATVDGNGLVRAVSAGTASITARTVEGGHLSNPCTVYVENPASTVWFESNGGSYVPPQEGIPQGGKVTRPTDPTKDGYKFADWYRDASLINLYDFDSPVYNSFTLYARWNAIYSVWFDSQGGSYVPPQQVVSGNKVVKPDDPEKDGCIFAGWYKESSLITPFDFNEPVYSSCTLFAKWKVRITWDADGGSVSPPYSDLDPGGTFGNLPVPTRKDCFFRGWYEGKSGTGEGPLEPTSLVPIKSTTYFAKWEVKISWNPNGGSVSPTESNLTVGSEFGAELPIPYRRGWSFVGWAWETDPYLEPSSIVQAEKTTYDAWWEQANPGETVITWNPNGGIVLPVNEIKNAGEEIGKLPDVIKKFGYTFDGWYDDINLVGTEISSETFVPGSQLLRSNVTYYAKWTPNNVSITWDVDDGITPSGSSIKTYGDSIGELPKPEQDGCVFKGWFTARNGYGSEIHPDSMVPASNTTYYAKWSTTITWNTDEGTVSPPNSEKIVGNAFGTLPTPTRPEYTFVGWKDSNGVYITPTSIVPASNTTYFAGWASNPVMITFDNDDGSELSSSPKTMGDPLGTLPNPKRDGCQFAGWYTLPNGGGTHITPNSPAPTSAATYYARWTVVINWYANGGDPSQTADVKTIGTAIGAPPPPPSRSKYSFEGWYTDITGGTKIDESVVASTNTTYYAHWSPIIDAPDPGNGKLGLLVDIAKGEIPYHEKNKGQNLYGTARGSENYTKYTVEMGWKNPTLWCHVFVSWAAYQSGLLDAKNDKKSANYLVPKTAGTVTGSDYFKAKGLWRNGARNNGTYVPSPGDIVYFWRSSVGRIGHSGIVTDCANGYVYTVEGNASDQVQAKRYLLTDKYIVGYGFMGGSLQSAAATIGAGLLEHYSLSFSEYVEDETDLELRDIPDENNPINWQASFPDAWQDSCIMKPTGDNEDSIRIYFVGKSQLSKGDDGSGFDLFYIIDENTLKVEPDWGSVYKLGIINAVTYYLVTPLDLPLAVLRDALDYDSSEYSEAELALIEADWHKAEEMMNGLERALNGKGRITSSITLSCYGQNLLIPADADPEPGVIVSGKIDSYDPLLGATIQLMQYGVEIYRTTIDPLDIGSGQIEQGFAFEDVEPGVYTLVVTKLNHLPYIAETIEVGNENVDLTKDSGMITLERAGVSLSGKIRSYNPNNKTTIQLLQGGKVIDETIIQAFEGSGQVTQDFIFKSVKPGTYTLVIKKDVHTDFTVNNVIVGEEDLDLTQDDREVVRIITLLCGDINGDGSINSADLNILWSSANYLKSTESATNSRADLNGDGAINSADLNILWSSANYLKGAVIID